MAVLNISNYILFCFVFCPGHDYFGFFFIRLFFLCLFLCWWLYCFFLFFSVFLLFIVRGMSCKVGFMVSLLVSLIEKFLLLFLFPYFCLSVFLQGQSINFHKQMHHFVLYSFFTISYIKQIIKIGRFWYDRDFLFCFCFFQNS